MSSILNNVLAEITLVVLFIVMAGNTIRSIFAFSGWFRKTRFERWIHSDLSDDIAKEAASQVLSELLRDTKSVQRLQIAAPNVIHGNAKFESQPHLEKLVVLLAKSTHEYEEDVIYGRNTPAKSKYYINTIEAAMHEPACNLMADLMHSLYTINYEAHPPIDFILTPKNGNPTLALAISKKIGALCLIAKGDNDHSRVSLPSPGTASSALNPINFEGYSYLIRRAQEQERKQYGVVLDCNCSGGSSIIRTANAFNQYLESSSNSPNISVVSHAYCLFRADSGLTSQEVNTRFHENRLKLHRYIDLNEDLKSKLALINTLLIASKGAEYNRSVRKQVRALVQEAKSSKSVHP